MIFLFLPRFGVQGFRVRVFKVLTVSRLAGFRRWVHDAALGLGFQGLGLRGLGSVVPKAHAGTQYLILLGKQRQLSH